MVDDARACALRACLRFQLNLLAWRYGVAVKDLSAADAAVDAAVLRVQEAERELRLARNAERQARARRGEEVRAGQARSGGA